MNRPGHLPRLASRIRRQEHGQIIVFAALIIVIVVGMGALAVDVGFFVHERENVQYAVDAGALAGAALLPDDGTGAATVAQNFTLANDNGLSASEVSASFRCLVGNVSTDVPAACNPGADASWTTTSTGLQVSPCVPASGDKCNVIVVSASNSVRFYLAPILHIKQGNTGSITSAACSGACGAPPTIPVDLAVIIDRTGSMSSSDLTNAKAAANALLQTYNPAIQYVALGTLGPSQKLTSCSGANSPAKSLGRQLRSVRRDDHRQVGPGRPQRHRCTGAVNQAVSQRRMAHSTRTSTDREGHHLSQHVRHRHEPRHADEEGEGVPARQRSRRRQEGHRPRDRRRAELRYRHRVELHLRAGVRRGHRGQDRRHRGVHDRLRPHLHVQNARIRQASGRTSSPRTCSPTWRPNPPSTTAASPRPRRTPRTPTATTSSASRRPPSWRASSGPLPQPPPAAPASSPCPSRL